MKIIEVIGTNISKNLKSNNFCLPIYKIHELGEIILAREVHIKGISKLVYNHSPLFSHSAWIETDAEIIHHNNPINALYKKSHIIHVNRQNMSMNNKDRKNRPVFTIKHSKDRKTYYGRSVKIMGESHLRYSGGQLSCGARAWIETESELIIQDKMTFKESRSF